MNKKTLITATTLLATSTPTIFEGDVSICIDTANGDLAGTETADLQYSSDGGATFKTIVIDGVNQSLTVNTNVLSLQGPILLKVAKSVSVASVGIIAIYP